jgi:uncharacterized protein YegP (UPF0339 family)
MKKIKGGSQIEIRKAGENEYYFVFMLPSSGIFMSNFFEHLEEALSAAENIKRRAAEENYYLYKNRLKNHFYFVFKIKKNSPIGQSSIYKDKQSIDSAIHYMKNNLVKAEIVDLTT